MDVVSRVFIDIGLLKHHICELNELLSIQLVPDTLILCHIVEQREYLLATRVSRKFIFLLKLALHKQVQDLGFVFHKDLVLWILWDRVEESNYALIQFNLMIVREVNYHSIVYCLSTA